MKSRSITRAVIDTARSVPAQGEPTGWIRLQNCYCRISTIIRSCSPEHVVKYLARYMTSGPISDRRLVSHEDGIVTFSARIGKTHGGSDETEEIRLSGAEFVRRWSLHILPKGFTRSRRFGGYSSHHRKRYITASVTSPNAANCWRSKNLRWPISPMLWPVSRPSRRCYGRSPDRAIPRTPLSQLQHPAATGELPQSPRLVHRHEQSPETALV